ncbi:ABC transporter permease [Streptomyces sp. NBC_00932]|uniref:ABC transporter permease n=1 Tax=Streptomyces sp. NBC_00932 TaxID=2903690 RepID=UPI003866FF4B|nr:ABC transporter permease [Streptomyces sp. NBC_00932]
MKDFLHSWKVRTGLAILCLYGLFAIFGPGLDALLRLDPHAIDYTAIQQPPSTAHWLGTTTGGEDVLAQLLVGTRGSITVGLIAGTISTAIAVLVGVIGTFAGGHADGFANFLTNLFLVVPVFPLILVVAGYLQGGGVLMIGLLIGFFGWPGGARTLRAQTLSLRRRDFIMAMRMLGERRWRLVWVEAMPHLAGWISAMFLHAVVGAVLAEAGLAFLGITSPDAVSWGTMIQQANQQSALLRGMWWWFVPPGACIALLGLAAGLVNFGIDEIANPRLKAARRSLVRQVDRRAGAAARPAPTPAAPRTQEVPS